MITAREFAWQSRTMRRSRPLRPDPEIRMSVRHTAAVVVAALAGCRSTAAQQQPQHLLRLSFEVGKSQFMHETLSMRTEQAGGLVQTAINMAITTETRVERFEGGKAVVAQTVRRLVFLIQGPPRIAYDSDDPTTKPGLMKAMADLVGKTIRMSIDERGRISDLRLPDDFDAERAFGTFAGMDAKELFGRGLPEFPDQPVAIGGTWTNEIETSLGKFGTTKFRFVNKLLAVEKGKAVVSQVQEVDGEPIALPGGAKMTMAVDESVGRSVISLATGGQLEVSADNAITSTVAGMPAMTMKMSVRMRAIEPAAAVAAKAPQVEVAPSTQAKAVVLEDVVLTISHEAIACTDFAGGRDCSNADHWRAVFTAMDGTPLASDPVDRVDGEVLAKVLAQTAAPRRKLESGRAVAEALLLARADRRTPYRVMQQLLEQAAKASLHRIAFAVRAPGPRHAGRVLVISLLATEDERNHITITLGCSAAGTVHRQFGPNILPAGAEGDRQSVEILTRAFTGWQRLGIDVPGIVDAQATVPWHEIVRLIDDFLAVGVEEVRFAGVTPVK